MHTKSERMDRLDGAHAIKHPTTYYISIESVSMLFIYKETNFLLSAISNAKGNFLCACVCFVPSCWRATVYTNIYPACRCCCCRYASKQNPQWIITCDATKWTEWKRMCLCIESSSHSVIVEFSRTATPTTIITISIDRINSENVMKKKRKQQQQQQFASNNEQRTESSENQTVHRNQM